MNRHKHSEMRACTCGAPMWSVSTRCRACYLEARALHRDEGSDGPMIISPWKTLADGTRQRFVYVGAESQ
jgi:hypothetical protein